ncbi:TDT family transporter [Chitinibacter tainanensis]|uniref:TDT family transporter n=1 Tax=Chitinibacter tainanensis TaxID=230667 RepID=UPI0023521CCD|nr:TDT family transporter [Chitinibacter tainanensis]
MALQLSQQAGGWCRQLPTPLAGLALGISGLGMCLDFVLQANGRLELVTMTLAALLLLALATRFTLDLPSLGNDLRHPVVGSVVPTFAMALMVVSHGLSLLHADLGTAVWVLAIGLHGWFLAQFIRHRRQEFAMHHMVPSWFVPPVGIAVAAVSWSGTVGSWSYLLAWGCMAFALACYAIMLPWMFYRLIFHPTIPEGAQPTIAILAAPASLTLAAYLRVATDPSPLLVMILLGVAVTMTLIVYVALLHLLRLPFTPGFAALTFPLAIGATALFKVQAFFIDWALPGDIILQVQTLARIELAIATVVIGYVAVRYAIWLAKLRGAAQ